MLSRRTLWLASAAVAVLLALAGLSAYAHWLLSQERDDPDGWREIAWPFPRDGFPAGKAWRGHGLEVYVRPKLGFCGNCDTGVVEDSEVDRVTDVDLLDEHFAPLAEGKSIHITDLKGRARLYRLRMARGRTRTAEAIAVAYKCDLVVAIVLGNVEDDATRMLAHRFIESNKVQVSVNRALEGR